MRRKLSPQPFARVSEARPLSAAITASRLPTAAALAIALASLAGCASRGEEVSADPVAAQASPIAVATEAAPSASAPGMSAIDPEPYALPGEPAIVAPVVSATAKPKHVPVTAPSIRPHRTAGVPMHVKAGPHDPTF